MQKMRQTDELIRCMYCGNTAVNGPRQNRFLLDLLWEQYSLKYGVESILVSDIMPGTLSNDIECRATHLKSLVHTLKNKIDRNIPEPIDSEIERANILIGQLEKIREEINELLTSDIDDDKVNQYLKKYLEWLTGNGDNNRNCQHFISICEQLLYYNKKVEFEKYFPTLNKKSNEWEHSLNTEEHYQPKIIDAFQAVQTDLGQHIIPSIPCRVGWIGSRSVGKSSLVNWLRGLRRKIKNSQNKSITNNLLASSVRVGKSTYCRLEFEHEYDNGQKLIFVDIEGSTDTDGCLQSANYFDEILRADCDIYVIVFDNYFTDIQHGWYEFIVKALKRECWLVRSKVDEVFRHMFTESYHQDFNLASEAVKNKYSKKVFEDTRREISRDIHGKTLPDVYLTFTSCDENLNKILYPLSDMEELIKHLQNLPPSLHGSRLQKMAVCAMAQVINTRFRRGYVVNIMKYKIAAGIAAVIPFADLIPRYLGREEIRQAFGINTNSRFVSWIRNTKDEFKDYLTQFNIEIDHSEFKTTAFHKTFKKPSVNAQGTATNMSGAALRGATAVGIAGISISDDVIRGLGVVSINAVRGLSLSIIVVGGVLTAGMCAWAAVSNGRQMYDYLNKLCDDLIIVSDHTTTKMIENNNTIRSSFSEKK